MPTKTGPRKDGKGTGNRVIDVCGEQRSHKRANVEQLADSFNASLFTGENTQLV